MYRFKVCSLGLQEFKVHNKVETEENMWYVPQEAGHDVGPCEWFENTSVRNEIYYLRETQGI